MAQSDTITTAGLDSLALIICDQQGNYVAGNAAATAVIGSLSRGSSLADGPWREQAGWPAPHLLEDGGVTRVSIGQEDWQVRAQNLDDGQRCLLLEPVQLASDSELGRAIAWLGIIDQAVLLLDDAGTVVFANGRAEREHGYETGGMVGVHLSALHVPRQGYNSLAAERAELVADLRTMLAHGAPRRYQAWHQQADGNRFAVTVVLRPRRVGQRDLILALVRDESNDQSRVDHLQRSLARLEVVSRSKSRVMASAGHDLRTPLTAILGFCDLLLLDYDDLDTEPGRSLERIRVSGHILDRQFSRLIEFYKLEDGRLDVDPVDISPGSLVRDVCEEWRDPVQAAGLSLRQDIDDSVDRVVVRTDPHRARSALAELLDNAVRVTKAGTILIRTLRDDGHVRFEVHDQGPGVSSHERNSIFEAFTDQGDLRFRDGPGIGIGLHMATGLASLIGGRLELGQATSNGAVFALILPLS